MRYKNIKPFVVPALIVLVFVFSIIGDYQRLGSQFNLLGTIYGTFTYFLLAEVNITEAVKSPFLLLARYLAALVLVIGVYSLLYAYVYKWYIRYKIRTTYRQHIVIFSLDVVGLEFCLDLLRKKYKLIVVEENTEHAHVEKIEKAGGIVLKKEDIEAKTFDMAAINVAHMCIVGHNDDKNNIELAAKIIEFLPKKINALPVSILVHVKDDHNLQVIKQFIDINNIDEHYDLETFNIYKAAARKMYDLYPPHHFCNFSAHDTENAIAIIGYNQVAEEFLTENLILSHYSESKNLKIYLVDKEADQHFEAFRFRFPFFADFVEIVPVKLLNENFFANFSWSKAYIEKLSQVKAAYFFKNNDSELLNNAISFRQFLYTQTTHYLQTPLVLCMPEDIGIINLLNIERENAENISSVFNKQLNIFFVRLISDTCNSQTLIEETEHTDLLAKATNYYYTLKYEFSPMLLKYFKKEANAALIAGIADATTGKRVYTHGNGV
jgi:hypothetical protein